MAGLLPLSPANGWDTRDWKCGLECFEPTHKGCGTPYEKKNGTGFAGSPVCWCDRTFISAGREAAPGSSGKAFSDMPNGYPPQCSGGFLPLPSIGCIDTGSHPPYKRLQAWSFDSAASMGCQECYNDAQCTGWRSTDNASVELFSAPLYNVSIPAGAASCVGAVRHASDWSGGNWFGISHLGGCKGKAGCTNEWYSTTKEGQCSPGQPLGTNGCSWRLVEERKYANASCVDAHADAVSPDA